MPRSLLADKLYSVVAIYRWEAEPEKTVRYGQNSYTIPAREAGERTHRYGPYESLQGARFVEGYVKKSRYGNGAENAWIEECAPEWSKI